MNRVITRSFGAILAALLAMPLLIPPTQVQAADLLNRSAVLGSTVASQVTTQDISFTTQADQTIGSIEFEYCSDTPFVSTPCGAINGFDSSAVTLVSQVGISGLSINAAETTNNRIVLSRTADIVAGGPISISLADIQNPSDANETFYLRLATYSTSDASGSPTDVGGVALSTAQAITIGAYVPPYLEFCVGVVIFSNNCSTAAGNQIALGDISENNTATAISKMQASTNAADGYVITMSGTTLTSGNNQITPITSPTVSRIGEGQFGVNLRSNSSPNIGLEATGPGTATPVADYGQANRFKFRSGDVVVDSDLPNDRTTFTTSYIANVDADQPKGIYTTTLTYICTATF